MEPTKRAPGRCRVDRSSSGTQRHHLETDRRQWRNQHHYETTPKIPVDHNCECRSAKTAGHFRILDEFSPVGQMAPSVIKNRGEPRHSAFLTPSAQICSA